MPPIFSEIRSNARSCQQNLAEALQGLWRRPFTTFVFGFNWKTAAMSAMLRAVLFFFTNLRAGHSLALKATLVEGCYAILTMGFFGAATERIRHARPAWLTGLVIWLCIPAALLTVQYNVHRFFGTPELRTSMIASFCFAALGTGFNWFAMSRGALLVGDPLVGGPHAGGSRRSFLADLRTIPQLLWDFVSAGPKALLRLTPAGRNRASRIGS